MTGGGQPNEYERMMSKEEEGKIRVEAMVGAAIGSGDPPFSPQQFQYQHHYQYGTFGNHSCYQPIIGSPPAAIFAPFTSSFPPCPIGPQYLTHGYQANPDYATFSEGTPARMSCLPSCGINIGWSLFILGFFLAAVPWYIGAFVLLCARIDYKKKPGFVACAIAAIITTFSIMLGATQIMDAW